MLRAGGNAVDAAVAAVLMSFVGESPLTGPGAGGFMLVHTAGGEDHLLDFFVAAPGLGLGRARAGRARRRSTSRFSEDAVQRFNVGPVVVRRVRHDARARARRCARFGTVALGELTARAGARRARRRRGRADAGVPVRASSSRSSRSTPECAAIYAPEGRLLREGEHDPRCPSWATCSSGSAPRGRASSTRGDVARAVSDWVLERGGMLSREDLASYEVIEREPARVTYRGREVLTNPPPSSGGILIADALGILERLEPARTTRS